MQIEDYIIDPEDSGKIVIYGASVGGKIICQCLRKMGIEPAFFCDRAKSGSLLCGLKVLEPSVLYDKSLNYKVVIAVTRSINSVCSYMKELDYIKCYSVKKLIQNIKIQDMQCEENEKIQAEDFLKKYSMYIDGVCERKLILPSLEVFITERCTLRCRDCSHLIPRYLAKGAVDYEMEILIDQITNILRVIDYIEDLIILGGEPLLHNELGHLLEWGEQNSKIGELTIISNATVRPRDEVYDAMQKTNTRIRLSDYGEYSVALEQVAEECKKRGISYFINREMWTDMGRIYNHHYTELELRKIFKDCPFAFSILLLKGKLYRCAHVAHLHNLGEIKSDEHDCIDFTKWIEAEDEIMKKQEELRAYMQIDYLNGCAYCNGIQNGIQGVEPAIQGER